jgi:hypothetical protein
MADDDDLFIWEKKKNTKIGVSQRIWRRRSSKERKTVCWDKERATSTKAELFKRLLMRVDSRLVLILAAEAPRPRNRMKNNKILK